MPRRFLLVFLFFVFYFINCAAQPYPQLEDSFIKSLRAKGADSILSFTQHSNSFIKSMEDSFYMCSGPFYMIWKFKGKTCFQKFNDCNDIRDTVLFNTYKGFESFTVYLDSSVVHEYIAKNFEAITESRIFPVIIKSNHNGRDLYYSISSSHPTINLLQLYLKDTVIQFEADDDYLRKDRSIRYDDGSLRIYMENANYDWNSSTALGQLILLVKRQINELEEKKKFIYKRPFP